MSRNGDEQRLRCPVCGAGYRGASTCSRCGADLERLMRIALAAYRLRGAARRALLQGDSRSAGELAASSLELHATANGRRLELLCRWWAETLGAG